MLIPLPFPDGEVYQTCMLRLQWQREGLALTEIIERIHHDPAWPAGRRGRVPVLRRSVFRPDLVPEWVRVDPSSLAAWYDNPALYGTYTFTAGVLQARAAEEQRGQFTVRLEHAFRSLAPAHEAELPARRRATVQRRSFRTPYAGPRNHLLPDVRCGEAPIVDGVARPCRRRLTPVYQADGSYRYHSTTCRGEGAEYEVSPLIEPLVLALLVGVFDSAALQAESRWVAAAVQAVEERSMQLARELATHQERMQGFVLLEADARVAGRYDDLATYREQRRAIQTQVEALQRELARRTRERAAVAAHAQADLAKLLALGTDLQRLLTLSQEAERAGLVTGLTRRIVRALVRCVVVRRAAFGVVEVALEFPTGARVVSYALTHTIHATAAERAYCAARARAGGADAAIAAELTTALGPARRAVVWTADRVRAAVLAYEHDLVTPGVPGRLPIGPSASATHAASCGSASADRFRLPKGRGLPPGATTGDVTGPPRSYDELVVHLGEEPAGLLAAILDGQLGPLTVASDGRWTVSPCEARLHTCFPEYARRWVAARAGWPLADTLYLSGVTQHHGLPPRQIRREAEAGAGVWMDASGREYVRASDVLSRLEADFEAALAAASGDLQALDRRYWVRLRRARELLGVTGLTLPPAVPLLSYHTLTRTGGRERTVAWAGPSVQAVVCRQSLADAVARLAAEQGGGEALAVERFVPLHDAIARVAERWPASPYRSRRTWIRAVRAGRVLTVEALAPVDGACRRVTYVYVPAAIEAAETEREVREWLGAQRPRTEPRRPRPGPLASPPSATTATST